MMGPVGWIWIVLWIAALLVMVWLIVRRPDGRAADDDAATILRARFARGEISESEYQRALDLLRVDRLETMG